MQMQLNLLPGGRDLVHHFLQHVHPCDAREKRLQKKDGLERVTIEHLQLISKPVLSLGSDPIHIPINRLRKPGGSPIEIQGPYFSVNRQKYVQHSWLSVVGLRKLSFGLTARSNTRGTKYLVSRQWACGHLCLCHRGDDPYGLTRMLRRPPGMARTCRLDDFHRRLGRLCPGDARPGHDPGGPHKTGENRVSHRIGDARGKQPIRIPRNFRNAPHIAGDKRRSAGERLSQNVRQTLGPARHHKKIGRAIPIPKLFREAFADEGNNLPKPDLRNLTRQPLP